jgi:hypothetical protein
MGLQEAGRPGAVAAGALHRPAAPTRHLRPGEVEQATIAGRIHPHRRLGEQPHHIGGGRGEGVAVGSTLITPSTAPARSTPAPRQTTRHQGNPKGARTVVGHAEMPNAEA